MPAIHTIRVVSACIMMSLFITACVSVEKAAPPIDEQLLGSAASDASLRTTLERGRDLYITACAKCHSARPIVEYTYVEWQDILPRMSEEARLSSGDSQAVEQYVMTVLDASKE